MSLTETAPAKVNLFLHVGAVEPNGRHPLCSLVVFADVGDVVVARPAAAYRLEVDGPFSDQIGPNADNLVTRALLLAEAPAMHVSLTKSLPAAAGLGGGTSDAAAALRLAGRLFDDVTQERLTAAATALGADGLMCLDAAACVAEGEGQVLSPAPKMPELHAVLVNPGAPSPTGAVYSAYDQGEGSFTADRPAMPPAFESVGDVARFLKAQRNDLEAPAIKLTPVIGSVLAAMARLPGVRLSRMSGSGATVFGLFDVEAEAVQAAARLRQDHPEWWVRSCRLNAAGVGRRSGLKP